MYVVGVLTTYVHSRELGFRETRVREISKRRGIFGQFIHYKQNWALCMYEYGQRMWRLYSESDGARATILSNRPWAVWRTTYASATG